MSISLLLFFFFSFFQQPHHHTADRGLLEVTHGLCALQPLSWLQQPKGCGFGHADKMSERQTKVRITVEQQMVERIKCDTERMNLPVLFLSLALKWRLNIPNSLKLCLFIRTESGKERVSGNN